MDELYSTPVEKWTESMVSTWLHSINVKEQYIKKLHEEEVDGQILLKVTEEFLKKVTGMKSGPALLIITERNEFVNKLNKVQRQHGNACETTLKVESVDQGTSPIQRDSTTSNPQQEEVTQPFVVLPKTKRDSKPRPFGTRGVDYTYVKHNVLQPESGVIDLITPCREYKAFTLAATLDCQRLQAKLAKEIFKFATGCMNMRSNGTIYFGVMDGNDNSGYVHGEIIGFPIQEKNMYADALNHIDKSFSASDIEIVQQCIRPPEFILVLQPHSKEEYYVVEVDIEPSVSIVRNRAFSVRLPNFKEKKNKTEFGAETVFQRLGSRTVTVALTNEFYREVQSRDDHREAKENAHSFTGPPPCQDLGRKLVMLVTGGKKIMEKEKWYILVTNKFPNDDLTNIDFLLNMKIFCVFDFDPDSKVSGLCYEYVKHHAVNLHFMQNYKIPSGMTTREFESHLHLFDQISWIFCNGRSDFKGNEPPCDEKTWFKTKRTLLKDCVSLICKDILPKGTFRVIFLLASPVERPLLNTFYEFFTDMEGHEDIICISESEDNFRKWQTFALESCDEETVKTSSVVGMRMSHVNATLHQVQITTNHVTKLLPVHTKGECCLERREEEEMCSLEILSTNQCEDTNPEFIESEKEDIEKLFYLGGKVTWMNFWLAEKNFVGEVIQRDVYHEVVSILKNSLQNQLPVNCINIYHHPGSGGSTVARQVLWTYRKEIRCAVVKPSYSVDTVSQHVVKLREYEEKDPHKCLPVLLLVEDCDKDYLDDLKNELEEAVYTKKIAHGMPCFILLSCRRSYTPENKCKQSPLQNISVTHKLSQQEKRQFAQKRQTLEQQFQPEFILTFILMSEEFKHQVIAKYVKKFVKHLLQDIDHASVVTQLIRYVALLNTYVQNSFISQSHCEALLTLQVHMERFRQHAFEGSLSEQAKLVFIHLRDERTHINSVRIIHPLVAKEILHQLLGGKQQQSDLALDLLSNDVLFEHRFGRDDYTKFLRALFMRRTRISKGDEVDSFFSPLIEHVTKHEKPEKAIELLKEAYKRFNKDAFFAQHLARLSYRHERFEEAEQWADTATKMMPKNSYILDTKGQVYRRWFTAKCNAIGKSTEKTPENTADAIEMALKAIDCFKECEKAAVADFTSMNNSGFFAEVEVGCTLLKLISSLHIFSNQKNGRTEFLNYFLTDYVPKEVEKPWESFHHKLKSLQAAMHKALDWISEDLSYFQTDLNTEEETSTSGELTITQPKFWLKQKSTVYGKFFSEASLSTVSKDLQSNPANLTPFIKDMIIYRLGGGNITTIFSIIDRKDSVKILEDIISLYPENPIGANVDQMDLANYIASHIALSVHSTQSPRLAALSDLQRFSHLFLQGKSRCLSSAQFLRILLFWPEEHDTDDEKENKYETVLSAVELLQKIYFTKMKDIPTRKRRIYTHFFLGNGVGYKKFIHKSVIETGSELTSVSEKRMKWFRGEMWKTPEIAGVLKSVTGWTENGILYLEGPKKKKFRVQAMHVPSVPYENENVTFYLGFTFRGPVAYNIEKMKPRESYRK